MAATNYAVIGQYAGSSWDNAFPQSPQTGTLDLDLIHIRGVGETMLAVVNHAGAVSGGSLASLTLTSVSVATFAVTSVAVTGGSAVYNGTFTGGGANAFVGQSVVVLGFITNPGNNGTFVITGSTGTTITVATTTQVNETAAATASVTGVSLVTYNGTITGGAGNALAGSTVVVTGFTNSTNNVTEQIVSSTGSTIVVLLAAQVNETHAATANITLTYTKGGTRVGTFKTFLGSTATLAAIFANAFANPSNLDILQIVSPTGEGVVNYIDYQGVSH